MNKNNDESDEIQRSANSPIVKEVKFDQKYYFIKHRYQS